MIRIISSTIPLEELKQMAEKWYGELLKAVVDVERHIIAVNGDMHADEEKVLLADGSKQEDLWGINIYPAKNKESRIEFDSMINLRPSQKNMSRSVENKEVQKEIIAIVNTLIVE